MAKPSYGTLADEFALLGEPFAVEFANTRYTEDGVVHDLISTPERFVDWRVHLGDSTATRIDGPRFDDVLVLRDATHELVAAMADEVTLPTGALEVVDAALARATHSVYLDRDEHGMAVRHQRIDDSVDSVLSTVALHTAEFVARTDGTVVRRCARPDCPLFFVPVHRRRRFCHPRCSNADRQRRHRGRQ